MYNCLLKLVFTAVLFVYSAQAAKSCNGTAKYTITFQGEWTSQRHKDFPSNPHFSPLVGCSHKAAYVMWAPGTKASPGVKNVAETGSTRTINSEINAQIAAKNASIKYQGKLIFGGRANNSVSDIAVTSEYPLVSFILMIAPSPDWFLGVRDLNLCDTTTGKWQDRVVRVLFPYDAGTDNGTNFESSNVITNPQGNIHRLTKGIEGSLKGDEAIKSFGTFTFVKTSENGIMVTIPPTNPTGTANLGKSFSITACMILCIMNILFY